MRKRKEDKKGGITMKTRQEIVAWRGPAAILVTTVVISVTWGMSVRAQGSMPASRRNENEMATSPQRAEDQRAQAGQATEDAKILTKMHLVNQLEIEAGRLAQQEGQSEQVRQFGERLARAHRDVDREVQSLARRQGIDLPTPQPGAEFSSSTAETLQQTAAFNKQQSTEVEKHQKEHAQLLERLQKAQGEEFDREFADAMVDGHRKTIDRLKDAKDTLADSEVRDLVDRTLAILESHQREAEQLKSSAS